MGNITRNLIIFALYTFLFIVPITIGNWGLTVRQILSLSIILAFFAGILNNIEVVLRELFDEKEE